VLLPGAYAFVHLTLPASAGAVTIPTNTLLFRAEGLRVAAVRNGEVKLVPIIIGRDYGSTVEATSNLTANDAAETEIRSRLAREVELLRECIYWLQRLERGESVVVNLRPGSIQPVRDQFLRFEKPVAERKSGSCKKLAKR
jgi:hypothetical protein